MGQVFISYAKDDEKDAAELYDELRIRGGKPWMDRFHLRGGEPWREAIKRAMGDSMHVIVFLSKHSLEKGTWREVQREIKYALKRRRNMNPCKTHVIPVRLDRTEAGGFIDFLKGLNDLREIHQINWSDADAMDQIWLALTDPDIHP